MNKIPIVLSWLLTHFLVYIAHTEFLKLFVNRVEIMLCFVAIHSLVVLYFNKVYTDIKRKEENCQTILGDCSLCIFIANRMATFKIKLEDKAAFLNRLKNTLDNNQIKDNESKGYFEVTSNNPKQIEQIEDILKQSPKINTIKEMKSTKLTKSDLREMVRQELKNVLNEEKEQLSEINFADPVFAPVYTALMFGGISLATWLQRISREKGERKEFLVQKMKDAAEKGVEFDEAAFDKEWSEKMATRREKEAERSKGALGRANIMVSKGGDDRFF